MPIIIDTGALLRPLFTADQFTATRWDSAEGKADFANKLAKFKATDFKQSLFTKALYGQLSNTFGHIAHFDLQGFYSTFFDSLAGKVDFLDQTMRHPCYGDPTFTFSDVERSFILRLRKSNLLVIYRALRAAEIEKAERAALARLKSQYEGGAVIPLQPERLIITRPVPPGRPRTPAPEQHSLF